mmetsp:Transcript_62184/g.135814  ORF Transcript_62184/g.135814 Transcript_62184/m.135814 type:complete len:206 (-) Transcript_62184:1092-1709(-)
MFSPRTVYLVSVVEHTHWYSQPLLFIPLREKFVYDSHGPDLVHVEGLKRVRYVREMEDYFDPEHRVLLNDLLHVLLSKAAVCLENVSVAAIGRCLEDLANFLDQVEVHRVVGEEDTRNGHRSSLFVACAVELLKDIETGVRTYFEKPRTVHILKGTLVVVAQGQHIARFDQKRISLAGMTDIVHQGRHQEGNGINIAQPIFPMNL